MSIGTLERHAAADLDLDLEVVVVENEPMMEGGASLTLTCAAICLPTWATC